MVEEHGNDPWQLVMILAQVVLHDRQRVSHLHVPSMTVGGVQRIGNIAVKMAQILVDIATRLQSQGGQITHRAQVFRQVH